MKTTQLIELQKAISKGEWRVHAGTLIQVNDAAVARCHESSDICGDPADAFDTTRANATAISLVPSLLREVVELRKGLARLLDERIVCDSADDQEFDEKGNFTCNSPACIHARSLLSTHN